MPHDSPTQRSSVIQVIEDGRTALDLFSSLDGRGCISHRDYNDIRDMVHLDMYEPQEGRQHLLTVLPREEVLDERNCSLAKILATGRDAGLEQYPLVAALAVAERGVFPFPRRSASELVFAHEPIALPRRENPNKKRAMILSIMFDRRARAGFMLVAIRLKGGRELVGPHSIAFGQPLALAN